MRERKIKLKFLLSLYNKFDFIIRFLYVRVLFLRDILQKRFFSLLYRSGGKKVYTMFSRIKETLDKYGIDIKDKTVLEIGPGTSLIMSFCFLHSKAKDILLVDKYPRWNKNLLLKELDYLKSKNIIDCERFLDDSLKPRSDVVKYIENSCEKMSEVSSGTVDIIISAGVLEHVKKTAEMFKEMNRVLKKDGIMYHYISLGDHYNFDKPFKFLKYSDFVWNNLLTKEGYSYTNRLRVDDYLALCAENGFEVVDIENVLVHEIDMKKINRKFLGKSEEALKTVDCYLLAKKT